MDVLYLQQHFIVMKIYFHNCLCQKIIWYLIKCRNFVVWVTENCRDEIFYGLMSKPLGSNIFLACLSGVAWLILAFVGVPLLQHKRWDALEFSFVFTVQCSQVLKYLPVLIKSKVPYSWTAQILRHLKLSSRQLVFVYYCQIVHSNMLLIAIK